MSEIRYQMPKNVRSVVELWTPERAAKVLRDANESNRTVSSGHVTALTNEILRGEYKVTHQGIGFDKDGKLIDGQHRLWAIVKSGIAVPMMTTYGLGSDAREAVDKGRKRSVADELKMLRGVSHGKTVASMVRECVSLYARHHEAGKVQIPTLSTLEAWLEIFKPGVDWAIVTFDTSACEQAFRRVAVTGALAFAHRAAPEKIEVFGEKLRDGAGLEKNEPAWALRRALHDSSIARAGFSFPEAETARKVLQAALAHVKNEKLTKIADGAGGLHYFAKAYDDSRKAKSLLRPWAEAKEEGGPANLTPNASAAAAAAIDVSMRKSG